MNSTPDAPQPAPGRRLFFLLFCLFGYVLLISGWWLARRSSPSAPREPVSILVLPFSNSVLDSEARGIGERLAPETTSALSKIERLRILKDESKTPANEQELQDLGRKWKVNAVLSGSMSKNGERLRLTAVLIDSATGYHVWSQVYESETMEPKQMAERITKGVVGALRGER